ncbi:MAG TPA: hypothetical protein QF753_18830 [Victivallales bacterium]|nr:hypothetical protein [Victivallales bacterium]
MDIRTKRIKLLLILFITWLILIFIIQYSHPYKSSNKSKLQKYIGIIIPDRGKIIDKNGKILSSYTKYYNLYIKNKINSNKLIYIRNKLQKILYNTEFTKTLNNSYILVKNNITQNEIFNISNLLKEYQYLEIKTVFKQNNFSSSQLKKYIGSAKFANNKWIGISGLEKKYNSLLSGRNGIYTVMISPKGQWLKTTWELKTKPVSGENLYLKNSKKDLLK